MKRFSIVIKGIPLEIDQDEDGSFIIPAGFRGVGTALKPSAEEWILCRRPLSESTVAKNVLRWGTGGINIDACRVVYQGDKPPQEEWNRKGSTGAVGANGYAGQFSADMKQAYADGKILVPSGRWPSNTVLSHSPSCHKIGVKKVRGQWSMAGVRKQGGWYVPDKAMPVVKYGDPDGMETVEEWECEPGCPIAELDRQSGTSTSKRTARGGTSPNPMSWGDKRSDGEKVAGHDDSGGSSRFFPNFEPEYEEIGWAKQVQSQVIQVDLGPRQRRDTIASVSGIQSPEQQPSECNTTSFGKKPMDQSPMDMKSTISTLTSKTTDLKTLNCSITPIINDCTADVNCEMASGGSLAESVENSNQLPANVGICRPRDGLSTEDAAGAILTKPWSIKEPDAPFIYVAKASRRERSLGLPDGTASSHPTVKPLGLMKWLVKLITPPGGTILDPFCGSGTTGCAAVLEGFNFIGIEKDETEGYIEIAKARIAYWESHTPDVKATPKPELQASLFDLDRA